MLDEAEAFLGKQAYERRIAYSKVKVAGGVAAHPEKSIVVTGQQQQGTRLVVLSVVWQFFLQCDFDSGVFAPL